jgi:UDP-glucose 4-epimerase
MSKWLATRGYEVTVLDNLSTGHREAVRWGSFVKADLLDPVSLDVALSAQRYDAVMHFCARSLVGESVIDPYSYYENNVVGTLNLLKCMQKHDVSKIVFSSTAAIFGNPLTEHIDENQRKDPINPYGASKLMVERILSDAAHAYGLRSVSLRYFNAAGASPDGEIGESHHPETHLIPNALRAVLGSGTVLKLFGEDYPTPDGTCIRDYIHVDDLAQAHERALDYLNANEGAHVFNLGNGRGFSVREVLSAVERVTGKSVPCELAPRRQGDPAVLVASNDRARDVLGWEPTYTALEDIIAAAWKWHSAPAY